MAEWIRCRVKFYFLLTLFFAPVGMGEWRSRVLAECDAPQFTEPIPELRDFCMQLDKKEQEDARLAAIDAGVVDDEVAGE